MTHPTQATPSQNQKTIVVRSGLISVKDQGSWLRRWNIKWLVLTEGILYFHKSENSPRQAVVTLKEITTIERIDRTPYCLLLETKQKRYLLSLKNDEELYQWLDDIYSRSGLCVSSPTNFVHKVHIGFDPVSGYTGMPESWNKALAGPSQPALKSESSTVRSGTINIKQDSWIPRWRLKWLALTEQMLTIHVSETSPPQTTINLKDITIIERTEVTPYCLSLQARGKRYLLSLKNDQELYEWLDDVYERSGMSVSKPTNFVHEVHVGVDPTGGYTGLPEPWSKELTPRRDSVRRSLQSLSGLGRRPSSTSSAVSLGHSRPIDYTCGLFNSVSRNS